jgi:hypothetical protein
MDAWRGIMSKRMTVVFDDEELYTAIKVEAARRNTPAKDIVAAAVKGWLEEQEELEDIEIARREIESYDREGGIPLEQVLKERKLKA